MRKFAIISEYNPFHSGHNYHIEQTKAKCDDLVVIMSGSFTQRGNVAITDKYTRAIMAIKSGADMVIELSTLYAISTADKFAKGAIDILNTLSLNGLSFGTETADIEELINLSIISQDENESIKDIIRQELDKGEPLAVAKARALESTLNNQSISISPNNTLAIEYLKALKSTNSEMVPYPILRKGLGYHSEELLGEHISATAIRKAIREGCLQNINKYLPFPYIYDKESEQRFHDLIMYKLSTMKSIDISKLYDVTEGLHNRISKCVKTATNYDLFYDNLKTKRYTEARLQRIMLYSLLDITAIRYKHLEQSSPYVRVLAIREDKKCLLSNINTNNIITHPRDEKNCDKDVQEMIELDNLSHKLNTLINKIDNPCTSMQVITI